MMEDKERLAVDLCILKLYHNSLRRAQKRVDQLYLGISLALVEKRHHPRGTAGAEIAELKHRLRFALRERDGLKGVASPKEWKRIEYLIQKGEV